MVYFLSIAILILLIVVLVQMSQIRRSRHEHEQKMEVLREVIVQLASNASVRKRQLELSDELMARLRSANTALSEDISAMVNEFVGALAANNLLR